MIMMINGHNHSEKMQRCQDYIKALEQERTKIQVFQRELPLCLQLVTQAIETCKQQLSGTSSEHNLHGQLSECSEQTSSDHVPVLEEFMPIKRASSHESDGEEQDSCKKPKIDTNFDNNNNNNNNNNDKDGEISISDKNSKKSDWLRSAQLWNQSPDPPPKEDLASKDAIMEVKKNDNCGAFHPFKKDKSVATIAPPVNAVVPPASSSSTAGSGGENKKEERKTRRCWSAELHKIFLQALQQLGGSHVATPKQIRELMKVDGLTNDEVKSHLQKYRLHTRRPTPSSNHHNNNTQTPQFVVVGGIWVPPEYASMTTTTTGISGEPPATSKGIYTPIAALPPPFHGASTSHKQRQQDKPPHSDDRGCSHSDGGSATSSSTHTTTVTPAY